MTGPGCRAVGGGLGPVVGLSGVKGAADEKSGAGCAPRLEHGRWRLRSAGDVEDQAQYFSDLCEGGRADVAEAVLYAACGHSSDVLALGRGAAIGAVGGFGVDLDLRGEAAHWPESFLAIVVSGLPDALAA